LDSSNGFLSGQRPGQPFDFAIRPAESLAFAYTSGTSGNFTWSGFNPLDAYQAEFSDAISGEWGAAGSPGQMARGSQTLTLTWPGDFARPGANGAGWLRLRVGTWTSQATYADFVP
jgi:hypothetical protein